MSNKKYRIPFTPSCWNCHKLKKSKRVIHENTLDKPHGGCLSMSAPSIMDAIAGYMCDNYRFGDKPDKNEMLLVVRNMNRFIEFFWKRKGNE